MTVIELQGKKTKTKLVKWILRPKETILFIYIFIGQTAFFYDTITFPPSFIIFLTSIIMEASDNLALGETYI